MDPVHTVNTLDLVCRRYIGKTLPLNVIKIIYNEIRTSTYERRVLPYLKDPMFVVKGSKIYRKNNSGWKTKYRIRRAFRYGR